MSAWSLRAAALTAMLLLAACGAGPSTSPTPATLTAATAHFIFQYPAGDAAAVTTIGTAAEREYARIVADLGVGEMPQVRVTFYADHAALEAATRAVAGVIPAWASGLVTSDSAIHMMSPGASGWGPADAVATNVVHEFAHCVTLHRHSSAGNHPRWLWESVAIFEARQEVDLHRVPYIAALTPPSFASLDTFDNTRVYDVGYSIGEFIVARWGQAGLARLIDADGDTEAALGVPQPIVERDWFAFVRERL